LSPFPIYYPIKNDIVSENPKGIAIKSGLKKMKGICAAKACSYSKLATIIHSIYKFSPYKYEAVAPGRINLKKSLIPTNIDLPVIGVKVYKFFELIIIKNKIIPTKLLMLLVYANPVNSSSSYRTNT